MYLPKFIYEPLPYLYATIGWLAFLAVDPAFGRLAGGLLVYASYKIWRMRRDFREAGWR